MLVEQEVRSDPEARRQAARDSLTLPVSLRGSFDWKKPTILGRGSAFLRLPVLVLISPTEPLAD